MAEPPVAWARPVKPSPCFIGNARWSDASYLRFPPLSECRRRASLSFPYTPSQPSQSIIDPERTQDPDFNSPEYFCMSDVLFLAAGIGGFVVFALYARALSRLWGGRHVRSPDWSRSRRRPCGLSRRHPRSPRTIL